MTQQDQKKQLKQKIYSILKGSQPAEAIPSLFQIDATLPQNLQFIVRQPILFVFENQHDWESIIKCLKAWNGMNSWTRGFYDRMKKRLQETPQSNLADHQLMPEISKLISKYQALYEIRKPLVLNIQKYLKKDEDNKNSNSVKSGRSINSVQTIKSINSVKSNPVPQSRLISESIQPSKSLQNVPQSKKIQNPQIQNNFQSGQSNKFVQSVQMSNMSQSIKNQQSFLTHQPSNQAQKIQQTQSLQNISSTNVEKMRQTEFPKPQMPKLSKISRMTEHFDPERQNSKSTGSNPDARAFNMLKKPNITFLRKDKDSNENISNTVSNPTERAHKRLTFGVSDELRGNLKLLTKAGKNPQKKDQPNQVKPQNNNQQKSLNSANTANEKSQQSQKQVPKNPQNLPKPNAFQRKQDVPIRVNPIFVTEKKQLNPNEQDQPKIHESSISRSITPHKPLIERKKIVLKKPSDFKPINNDSSFEEERQEQVIYIDQSDDDFFSERKPSGRKANAKIEEVRELQKQIKSMDERREKNNARVNPQREAQNIQKQSRSQQQAPSLKGQRKDQKKETLQDNMRKHAQKSHASLTRREDQLFSDYELSLMNFNPNETTEEVNIYNILKRLKLNLTEQHTEHLRKELEMIKQRKAQRPRRTKL